MGANSKIEWTDASWNPIRARLLDHAAANRKPVGSVGWHCTHVSEGCRFCYAEVMNRRLGTGLDYKPGHEKDIEIFLDQKMLLAPLRWKRQRKIFPGSMTDMFADFVTDEWLDSIFAVAAVTPRHTYQFLTKRPERMRRYLASRASSISHWEAAARSVGYTLKYNGHGPIQFPLQNVWLGTSCEDQSTADERIPHLLATPAAVRFLSLEPLLGPIDLTAIRRLCAEGFMRPLDGRFNKVSWIICGGESGPHARPMHPDWARSLRDQCAAAGVPFFFKQWGQHQPVANDVGDGVSFRSVGKSRAGRLLDGIEHSAFPEPHP